MANHYSGEDIGEEREITYIQTIIKHEVCALLGYYAASNGNRLPTFRDNVLVPS
jgi:hypothetical protein